MEDKIKQFLKTIKLNESLLSMLFGMVTVVLVGVLVFRMYQANRPEITEEAAEESSTEQTEKIGEVEVVVDEETGQKTPAKLPETYTVKAGDHLWAIAQENYGSGYNWVDIAKENNLDNPGVISEGQELKLPKVAVIEIKTPGVLAQEELGKIEGATYKVQEGDNLWEISLRAYADGYRWPEIAKANELANANVIEVGQELKLPR